MSVQSFDPDRVRFVVERFEELKGLREAWLGCVWLSVFGGALLTGVAGRLPEPWALPALFLLGLPLSAAGLWQVDRYYDRYLGRVRGTRIVIKGSIWSVAVFSTAMVVSLRSGAGVIGYLVVAGSYWLWIAVRDWPHRGHFLLATLAVWIASAWTMVDADVPGSVNAQAGGLAAIGSALTLKGLMDHHLLTGTLPGWHPGAGPNDQIPDMLRDRHSRSPAGPKPRA